MPAVAPLSSVAAISPLEQVRAFRRRVYAAGKIDQPHGEPVPVFPVGLTEAAADFLRDLVVRERPRHTIETGLGMGLSACAIVEGLLSIQSQAGDVPVETRSHLVIDPIRGGYLGIGTKTLQESGADAITTVLEEDSTVAMGWLAVEGGRFDMAFIDGGHMFEWVFIDLFNALRVVKPGGLIVLDDHWMPSVQAAMAFYVTNRGVQLELFTPGGPGARLVALRVPMEPDTREWNHFAPFSRENLPPYPWRK